ncbi:MAG: AMP-binding protein [Pseudomonadota bacterium]
MSDARLASETHPPWFSGETPPAEQCVLAQVLRRRAAETPNSVLVSFESGDAWSCAEAVLRMEAAAELLLARGVGRGSHVAGWLPNGPELLQLWLGCSFLGAVFVPLNTDFRGGILGHVLRECRPALMAIHPLLCERLDAVSEDLPARILAIGESGVMDSTDSGTVEWVAGLPDHPAEAPPAAELGPWDLQMVIFTSGTTGPSKGVLCPYGHIYATAQATYGYLRHDDTMLTELPIFHVGGAASVVAALVNGARLAIYAGFSTDGYWERIGREGATATSGLIGSMADFLAAAPPAPDDADNSLRMVTLMLTEQAMRVARRFGFHTLSGFNMTELSGPLITETDCPVAGSLGRPRAGCECRVVDDHDMPREAGEVGELVVRSEHPWTLFAGYLNRPEATAEAWRNGWFHTGDLVRCDGNGNYFFVDRKKDAIRRRGENVSSAEVEAEVLAHPGVTEVCAVAVPSELAEDEILIAYVVADDNASADADQSPTPQQLAEFLVPRMPHYMVPRYFRPMKALPRTPTNKVRKVAIREDGVGDDCWDREAAGMILKRTRFTASS